MERKHAFDLITAVTAGVVGIASAFVSHQLREPPPQPLIHITKPVPDFSGDAPEDPEEPLVLPRGDGDYVLNNRACL